MTTWLEDASANRHIKTYVKDFLDVSGNMTVRQYNEDYKWNSYGQVLSGVYESDDYVFFGIGMGMDVSGLTIVVGANFQNGNNISNGGAVTVYRYDTTAEIWYQLGNLITGESNNGQFGWNVDINDAGTRIITVDPVANFVNVYDYNSGTNTWDKQLNLTTSVDYYGGRISGDGNTIVFNANANNSNTGIQYVYRNTSGTTWTKIGEFTGSHTDTYAGIGASITYDGNRITVTEKDYNYDANGNTVSDLGRAAIYDYSGSGTTWNQVGDWLYGDNTEDKFASSGDLSKDGSIVAFSSENGYYVKVYQYDAAVTGSWKQLGSTIIGDIPKFGTGLRISDDGTTLLLSSPDDDTAGDSNGSMYIYKYIGYDWVQQGSALYGAYTSSVLGYQFNTGVSMSGDGSKIVAGGLYADVNGTNSGYVQAFQWSQKSYEKPIMDISGGTLTMSNGEEHKARGYTVAELGNTLYGEAANDHFGIVAEMNKDGSVVAIGAKGVSSGDGAVYVYTYRSGVWQQKGSTISPYSSFSSSQFGFGVDINDDGNVIVTGSTHQYNDNGASVNDAGSLDVFEFTNGDWVQKGRSFKGIAVDDHLGLFSSSINGAGNIIAGLFHMSGFVRVYQYDDDTSDWVQMGGDIPMTSGVGSVAEYWQTRRIDLSEDGTIIVLGDVQDDTAGADDGKITIYKYTVVDNVGSWNKLGDDIVSPNGGVAKAEAFGAGVSLSSDGHTVAFSSIHWNDNNGLARIFKYSEEGNVWTQLGADFNATTVANYGGGTYAFRAIALSGDGKTFMHGDGHNGGGVSNGGAVHMYKYLNGQWNHFHTEYGTISNGYFGLNGVGMSRDGTRFVASTGAADYPGTDQGYSRMFEITNPPFIKIDKDGVSLDNLFTGDNVTLQCPTLKGVSGATANYESFWGINPGLGDWNSSYGNQNAGYLYIDNAYNSAFDLLLTGSYTEYGGGGQRRGHELASRSGGSLSFQTRIESANTNEAFSLGVNAIAYNCRLTISGAAWSSGSYYSSDDRIKHNETTLTNALETIRKLNPQHYIKTIAMYDADHQLELDASGNPLDASGNPMPVSEYTREDGFIAQEVNEIPELKYTFVESVADDQPHGLDYTSIFTTAVKALKELDELDGERQTKLSSLQARIDALEIK